MGVVEIERMAERAVEEGGAGRGPAARVAEHAGMAGADAERPGGAEQGLRALRVVAGAHDVADQVEHEQARALHHLRRQPWQRHGGAEPRKIAGDSHSSFPPTAPVNPYTSPACA